MSSLPFNLLERDLLPDSVIRTGIRRLLEARLREEDKGDPEAQQAHLMRFVEELRRSPVAIAIWSQVSSAGRDGTAPR